MRSRFQKGLLSPVQSDSTWLTSPLGQVKKLGDGDRSSSSLGPLGRWPPFWVPQVAPHPQVLSVHELSDTVPTLAMTGD